LRSRARMQPIGSVAEDPLPDPEERQNPVNPVGGLRTSDKPDSRVTVPNPRRPQQLRVRLQPPSRRNFDLFPFRRPPKNANALGGRSSDFA
jgi:hypothetical protein